MFRPYSTEQMQETYWSLGDQWWKQIIDGDCHEFGPEVFDKGLHSGAVEPGFLKSLYNGMLYASDELGKPLSIEFYKTLHQQLCNHFAGDANDTLMSSEGTGKYRTKNVKSDFALKYCMDAEMLHHYLCVEISGKIERAITYRSTHFHVKSDNTSKDVYEAWKKGTKTYYPQKYRFSKKFISKADEVKDLEGFFKKEAISSAIAVQAFEKSWGNKINSLNEYILKISQDLECPRFVMFSLIELNSSGESGLKSIKIDYLKLEPHVMNSVIEKLFHHFNTSIQEPQSRKSKLTLIADLYQKLDWLHPFLDGQGRVDLVLLSKLLTENGFHPAILDDPYFSSTSTLSEWVEELEKGLIAWEKVHDEINAQPRTSKRCAARL
ncbi:MAG: Fic family protein [Gammaproteobacteria bacterium]